MTISPFVAGLRAKLGTQLLLLPSVTVLPRDAEGRVLLVRQTDNDLWSTIGGTVEPGESPAAAGVREAKEEAGIEVVLTDLIAAVGGSDYEVTYPNGDRTAYVSTVYAASVVGGVVRPDYEETNDVRWFTIADLHGLALNPWTRALMAELRLS